MSNFSTIYTKIRATIPTLTGFTTKSVIPNAYTLEDNNQMLLYDGWGVKVGSSNPQQNTYKLQDYVTSQEFEIVLTRSVPRTSSDPAPIISGEESLRNDINTIAKDFTTTRFSIADKIEEINISSITSIENVSSGKFKYITASIIFNILHWR